MTSDETDVALCAAQQFLDGHFSTLESLELIDDVLINEESTHVQLESALDVASRATQALQEESVGISKALHDKALVLTDLHSEVVGETADNCVSAWQFRDGTEVMELVASLADELQSYEKLRHAKSYIDALLDIEQAKHDANQCLSTNAQGLLSAFSKSIDILAANCGDNLAEQPACSSAASDDSTGFSSPPSNLQEYIKQSVHDIWKEANQAAATLQSEALGKLGWPAKIDLSSASAVGLFDASFSTLTSLDCIARSASRVLMRCGIALRANDAPLLPLEHMARAVDIRMRYHFESGRATSRADKPEWWLSQVLSMLRTMVPFLESHVQRLVDGTAQLPHIDVRNEFILLVLPVVQRKLSYDRASYTDNGLVIAQVVHELADFQNTLRDVYFFDGHNVLDQFLADVVLFSAWVEAERVNATESYMQTISEPNPFELVYDDDMLGADDAKPSRLAEKVVLVIEDVAEKYSMVPSCMQRLQMLSTVQFPILIALVEDIEGEIDEFSRVSLAFMRDAGITSAIATKPSPAAHQSPLILQLTRLASWYQTIWYVEEAVSDWNNSASYIDLWAAVCHRAATLGDNTDPRDWRTDCNEWNAADRALLDEASQNSLADDTWLDSGIWERSVGVLKELKQNVLDLVGRAINKEFVSQLRAYRKKSNWAVEGIGADADVDVSVELGGLLPELTSVLSALGSMQFAKDVSVLGQILRPSSVRAATRATTARGLPQSVLPKAKDCSLILACSLDSTEMPVEGGMPLSLGEWGLTIVDPAASDQETELVLRKLGILHLSAKEARRLVGRRIDFVALAASNSP
ncbi:hypothetical protein EV174_002862 [Coemansia sp. RSA 2320]|nr:hypothetical protein EV174_002862 [Coemansia sp. RSA 2320]